MARTQGAHNCASKTPCMSAAPWVTVGPEALGHGPVTGPTGATGRRSQPAAAKAEQAWWRDAAGALAWLSVLVVTALWVVGGGVQGLGSLAGALISLGRLTGLVASDLLLIQVLLMARIPFVERSYGQDELARRHRLVGFTSVNLLGAHIVLITLGYAASTTLGLWGTIVDFVLHYPGMLLAVAGTVALCMVVVTSVKKAAAGCATSRGTSSTSTPTSEPGWPSRTSCGPGRTSLGTSLRRSSGGACMPWPSPPSSGSGSSSRSC